MSPLELDIPGATTVAFTTVLPVDGALLELEGAGVSFSAAGRVTVEVAPVNEGFLVTGILEIPVELACSRCLAPAEHRILEHFRIVLSRDSSAGDADDEWVFFAHDERTFDLAPLVRDLIIVALPAKPLCDDRCLGLCPVCGSDRNQTRCHCINSTIDPRWAGLLPLAVNGDVSPDKEEASHGTTEEEDIQDQA
ncbi:DUF177 domain-containing protein [Candidatus Fermentibacteria bacterium]|nr:DUF177 domain-containing protein [Candidatus Fermentibacteria bacterium]